MDNIQNIKITKTQVQIVLERFEYTRNSDISLVIKVWEIFYVDHIMQGEYIKLNSLHALPTQERIKRIRARFQNREGRYLPTIWSIAYKRGISADAWREAMGRDYLPSTIEEAVS